MILYTKVFKIL